jgi:CDP-diacylglycerol---glycerol-3-phosphate 3-phosphatidyltransferase
VLMWIVVFFALASAVSYFGKFWRRVDESIKGRRRRELLTLERRRQRAMMRQRSSGSKGAATAGLGDSIWKPPEVN